MKTVLVTGSTSGIGLATARLFSKNGYHVIINGRREESGKQAVKEIQSKKGSAVFIKGDVSKLDDVKKLFLEIKKTSGNLDVLINNAGGSIGIDDFYKATYKDLIVGFERNFFSAFYCCQEVVGLMKTGAIVNVGTVCGLGATPVGEGETIPIYSAAKAALHNLSQNLAKLLAPHIRVNLVVPGYTKTPAWGEDFSQENEQKLASQTWTKRFNTPEEIADAIWLLATNEAMTGSQVIVDGGLVLK